MNWIKKLGCLCAVVILVTGIETISSYAIMDREVYEIPLGQGMTLKKINEVYDSGVQKINIVTADLNNPNIKLDLLFNKNGIAKRGKLSSMVQQENNVVAAMNADFFFNDRLRVLYRCNGERRETTFNTTLSTEYIRDCFGGQQPKSGDSIH